MAVEVERQLAALGKHWNATIAQVELSEITSRDAADGTRSVTGVDGLGSAPTGDQPPWTDRSNVEQDSEAIMLLPSNHKSRGRSWITLGAVAAAAVLIVAGFVVLGNDDDPGSPVTSEVEPATTAAPTTATPTTAAAAVELATQFIEARVARDDDAVRSLVADDAEIVEWGETRTIDEYPSGREDIPFERRVEWQFLRPQCTATAAGPPAEVTCTYLLETAISRALGVGPFTGSSIVFEIADGEIQHLDHEPDLSEFSPQAFNVYTGWLSKAHPGWDALTEDEANLAEQQQWIPEFKAVGPALQFLRARYGWDGEALRSLVADDAVIDGEFSVADADDYVANAEFERIMGWRFLQVRPDQYCAVSVLGPPAIVTCTYDWFNALTVALDVARLTGSFELEIADGQIQRVTHEFDTSQYSAEVLEPFKTWLDETHPGDNAVMFDSASDGSTDPSLTPEALTLWEQRVPEFIESRPES
jgi:hypothetical protein